MFGLISLSLWQTLMVKEATRKQRDIERGQCHLLENVANDLISFH